MSKRPCRPGRLNTDDYLQGLVWLEQLKFLKPGHRGDKHAIRNAVMAFQAGHPNLTK